MRAKRREAKKAEKKRRLLEKLRGFQLEESRVMPALSVAEREYQVVRTEWSGALDNSDNSRVTYFEYRASTKLE